MTRKNKHYLVAIEGPDGVGKTTIAQQVTDTYIRPLLGPTQVVSELDYTKVGQETRRLMFTYQMHIDAHPFVFAGLRIHTVNTVILPMLENTNVVLDRYFYSGLVYPQILTKGWDTKRLEQLALESSCGVIPDVCVVLDVPEPGTIAQRLYKRTYGEGYQDWYDQEALARLATITHLYRRVAKARPECVLVDASGNTEQVTQRVWETIAQRLGLSLH